MTRRGKKANAVSIQEAGGHVNFFAHLEAGETTANTNKEHEEEKKKEQEDYEKKMGILVGLGQDSQELTGEKSWWQTSEVLIAYFPGQQFHTAVNLLLTWATEVGTCQGGFDHKFIRTGTFLASASKIYTLTPAICCFKSLPFS